MKGGGFFDGLQPLLDEKMKFIYKYLIKIGANPRDAEDILQETVYKFIIHIESIAPQKASSWIFRVALNQYYDLCRKQKKQVTVSWNYKNSFISGSRAIQIIVWEGV